MVCFGYINETISLFTVKNLCNKSSHVSFSGAQVNNQSIGQKKRGQKQCILAIKSVASPLWACVNELTLEKLSYQS